jgi:hypothetical protein
VFGRNSVGCLIGIIIGSIPAIDEILYDKTAPLRIVNDFLSIFGYTAIYFPPVIIGANLFL